MFSRKNNEAAFGKVQLRAIAPAASQRVHVAATIEILFGKNCRTYEIWGLKITSEAIS